MAFCLGSSSKWEHPRLTNSNSWLMMPRTAASGTPALAPRRGVVPESPNEGAGFATLVHAGNPMTVKPAEPKMNVIQENQDRWAAMIASGRVIHYYRDLPDKECPDIKWNVYGAIDTGEVVVSVGRGEKIFFHCERSLLISPPMASRVFGIDAEDDALAQKLADELWSNVKTDLSDAG